MMAWRIPINDRPKPLPERHHNRDGSDERPAESGCYPHDPQHLARHSVTRAIAQVGRLDVRSLDAGAYVGLGVALGKQRNDIRHHAFPLAPHPI